MLLLIWRLRHHVNPWLDGSASCNSTGAQHRRTCLHCDHKPANHPAHDPSSASRPNCAATPYTRPTHALRFTTSDTILVTAQPHSVCALKSCMSVYTPIPHVCVASLGAAPACRASARLTVTSGSLPRSACHVVQRKALVGIQRRKPSPGQSSSRGAGPGSSGEPAAGIRALRDCGYASAV
jgi:hypothetical protein